MKFSRVSIPASDAVIALSFRKEKCHEFSMCALTCVEEEEVPGWGQGGGNARRTDNARKNVLIGPIYNFYRNVLFSK